jgi:hypothetical protein
MACLPAWTLSAKSGLPHRSKQHRYSTTSSACKTNDSGIVNPSALAALRSMTSSNLVGRYNNKDSEVPAAAKPDF